MCQRSRARTGSKLVPGYLSAYYLQVPQKVVSLDVIEVIFPFIMAAKSQAVSKREIVSQDYKNRIEQNNSNIWKTGLSFRVSGTFSMRIDAYVSKICF